MIPLLESPAAQRLAWTLLHFLWQGALLGLAAWGAFALLRHRRPQLRYLVGCALLLACLGCAILTFGLLAPIIQAAGQPMELAPIAPGVLDIQTQSVAMPEAAFSGSDFSWRARLQPYLPWILAFWALGVALLSLRTLGSWVWLRRLKASATAVTEPEWLERLVRSTGLRRTIRFLESARVITPMCMGLLRPVVLLPLGFFTNLDPLAAEAVLAHELAHIKRLDGLVNGLQCVIEVLFFFHPAVWWLSRRIRTEREHCCDDAAVLACGDAIFYAETLSRLDALQDRSPSLALSARGGNLMERMRRLLFSDPPQLRFATPSLALVVALALGGTLPAQAEKPKTSKPEAEAVTQSPAQPTGNASAPNAPEASLNFKTGSILKPLALPLPSRGSMDLPATPGQLTPPTPSMIAPPPSAMPQVAPTPEASSGAPVPNVAAHTPADYPGDGKTQPHLTQRGAQQASNQEGVTATKNQGGLPVLKGSQLPTAKGPDLGAVLLPPYTAIIEDEIPEHRVNWYAVLVPAKTTFKIQARSDAGGAYLRLKPSGWTATVRQPFRGYQECSFTNEHSSERSIVFHLAFDANYPGPRRIAIHQTLTPIASITDGKPITDTPSSPSSPVKTAPFAGQEPTAEEARLIIQAFASQRPWGDNYSQTIAEVRIQGKERWNGAFTSQWPTVPEKKHFIQGIKHLDGWVVTFQLQEPSKPPATLTVLLDKDGVIHWRNEWPKLPYGLNKSKFGP